ncbi:MAG: helix-turn-helix transcriptional regulator [Alphaproteobacteria bacterium]
MFVISAKQIRGARGLLDWSQDTLAMESGLCAATIRKIEKGEIAPSSAYKLREAFEKSGIEFFENDGLGFRKDSIKVYQGENGLNVLFELFEASKANGNPVNIMCRSRNVLAQSLGITDIANLKRLEKIVQDLTVNCLLADAHETSEHELPFKYRVMPNYFISNISHFAITSRYIIIAEQDDSKTYNFIVMKSIGQLQSFLNEFEPLWKAAIPLNNSHSKKERRAHAVA